jgi:hypothetical protein
MGPTLEFRTGPGFCRLGPTLIRGWPRLGWTVFDAFLCTTFCLKELYLIKTLTIALD